MITCKDTIDLLLQYLENEMTPEQQQHLESHLGGCSPCVEFLKTYKQTSALCRRALKAKMPEGMADSLTAFLRKHATKS